MKNILSIDGGGIRGIIPAIVLAEIERVTGKPICQLFDLITGTSTGGILALGLVKDSGSGEPQFSAKELIDIYRQRGRDIFSRSFWKGMSSVAGLMDEKYPTDGIEKVLEEYLGHEPLGAALNNVMITSYDLGNRKPLFFKSWKTSFYQTEMRHVARATSAAPTYFEPALIPTCGSLAALIDGGVFINNPAVSAYAEALKLFPGEDIRVLSIGTGELIRPIDHGEACDWGKAGWMLPVLDCVFDGVSNAADYQMEQFLGENYIRLQVALEDAADDMDNASKGNIRLLEAEAERLLEVNRHVIESLFSTDGVIA
ncbi:patatin-like phospholipase family protein [uncultured Thalassolituus sp.]|uniref:patatin-like phospholipase family protein n=1 Tax=uncultured Thalassolituus sp. TaxID=285273 RepID=UPI002622A960|nr:patatin-like phospholipase family protein [uncultured Thalassolituus sp.]